MAGVGNAELPSILINSNESDQSLTEHEEITQTLKVDDTTAPSFGDGRSYPQLELAPENAASSCQETKRMEEIICPIQKQLEYLLNKADEFQTQLLWRDCLQDYEFAHIVPMFLEMCQPFFNYLESTARSSNPFRPPLSPRICTQYLQFSQQLCSRLEQLVLLYASFSFFSLEESDPLSISHFSIGQCLIDNMKLSIFRYCCPTPFQASSCIGLYKRMRWNVEREENRHHITEFYFLCCEDVIECADVKSEDRRYEEDNIESDSERKVERIWSIGLWVQTYPDPDTEDITDWVLCSVPCGQYKQMMCLGQEEPSSCYATDSLLRLLLPHKTHTETADTPIVGTACDTLNADE
ncbi:hypothetical protein DNTS_007702 [Danionella cerebrum]|uniref:Uncharacterized protein n=1 Tax=Danionella cerebrum TaxID=2873325 RepID=A0A553QSA4_9TELE|nr:hypothetical protein DNTS_007702 [Danionella translucida]